VLLHQRFKLFQPVGDLSALLVKEVVHDFILFTSIDALLLASYLG
jgi:hypothetical protein